MTAVAEAFKTQAVRRLRDQNLPRVRRCLSLIEEDELWAQPSPEVASIGALLVHLCGNVRQHILSGLGGQPDVRVRADEFTAKPGLTRTALYEQVAAVLDEAAAIIMALDDDALLKTYGIQGKRPTGMDTVIHVVEHYSYHVGQISLLVKRTKAIDLGYFAGEDLNLLNDPPPMP